MMNSMDWAELPPELLELIAKKLKSQKDYVRFRAVCLSWQKSTQKTPKHLPPQLPWLMLPRNQESESNNRSFLNFIDDKTHTISLPEDSNNHRRCGSSHGWLVVLNETDSISIQNPLTNAKKYLPPLSSFPNVTNYAPSETGREYTVKTSEDDVYTCNAKEMRDSFIKKVIFSSSPSNEDVDFYALAILNQTGDLAYCKKGDESWKFIHDANSFCEDVVFYKGCFYAVSKHGTIACCDVNAVSDNVSVSFIETPRQVGGDMQYLVKWKDELLLVTRYTELEFNMDQNKLDIVYKTTEFRVNKLVLNGPKWENVNDLETYALFLGENSSMSFCAMDFPGCKPDCIYFTDDYSEWNYDGSKGNHDLGVFDLKNGCVEGLPCYRDNFCDGRRWPPPIWFSPSLH